MEEIDTVTVAYLDRVLSAVAEMGATTAVAQHSARGVGHDHLVDRMTRLCDRAEDHGVTPCFETVGHAGGSLLDRVGRVAEDADATVCLDVGYAYLEAGVDGVVSFLDSYVDLIDHLQVHGARHRGDTHIPVGSGGVDFETLGPHLADADPATATVEVFTDQPGSARRFETALAG